MSFAKWLEIVRFELVFQLRQRATWLFFGVFLVLLGGQTNGQVIAARGREILFNSPLFVAESSVGMVLIALIVMAAVMGDAATRDVQTRMEPLMHAAPVSRAAYLGGRFFGGFLVCALLVTAVPLALLLAPYTHGLEAELAGPLRPAAHLQSFFLLVLPNAFVAAALLFSLAAIARHTLGSYLGAVLVLAGMLVSSGLIGAKLGRWELAKLLDPTGSTPIRVLGRTWAPGDLNARMVGLEGGLLWNRLLWLGIALAALAFAYSRFGYGGSVRVARWRRSRGVRAELDGAAIARGAPIAVPDVPREFGTASRVRQTLAIARDSLREMVTAWSWLGLPFLVMLVTGTPAELQVRGTPILPTTGRVLESFDFARNLVLLLVVLFAGELVWRERDANLQSLADAAPVPNGARFVGKLLGLWMVIAGMHALLALSGMALQARLGWYDFEPGLYLKVMLGIQLIDPLVFALFALSVHVVVNHKHVGHLMVLLVVGVLNTLAAQFRIEHPLLRLGSEPAWRYSPISGFGPSLEPLMWFEAYWAAWALLVALVARLFWVRGVERGLGERVRIARRHLTGRAAGAAAGALGLVLLTGGFIFYNTNVLNDYRPAAENPRRQAEYEQRYGRFEGAPQPRMTATKLNVELYPDRGDADIRGAYHLVNHTPRPIDTIHVAVSPEAETGAITFGRPARAAAVDDYLGHRTYVLATPLQPGDSLRASWRVRHKTRGFGARGVSTAVVENGSFIRMHEWMPIIGYQSWRELGGAAERREHGLPPRAEVASLDDVQARTDPVRHELVHVEVTIGTAAGQTAVAPGTLLGTWTRGGRRYFRYATAAPIGHGYALFSAKYAVSRKRWHGITLEVLHHPGHGRNVPRMMRGMEASLEQFTRRFGPYPYGVLRMVEYPAEGGSLHAAHATVWYQELFSLFDPANDKREIDLPFAITAHEVAHQFQPMLAQVEGQALLSESFAWYAAMGVIEQQFGQEHLARFLGFMRRDYLSPRSRADVPLLRASDWFVAYRKGPFAMYALREYVGEERVDLALRRFLDRHRSNQPPFATSLDLYRELRAVTPDSLRQLLGDLFERNTFWELETHAATARPAAGGAWRVSLEVEARKVVVDTAGAETNMPMNDLVEIGVFAPGGKPLYLSMHRVRSGRQTITVTVPRQPGRAGIDPRHLLIDVEPDDNDRAVRTES